MSRSHDPPAAVPASVVVVGAGVAGLSCARRLVRDGVRPVLLERSRGVGGRCATRRVDGQPVDHGPAFLHGSSPAFLRELLAVEGATVRRGWPLRIEGTGAPCQPFAFAPGETCMAFEEGVSRFPKHLARGLDVRLESPVHRLEADGDGLLVAGEDACWRAPRVVLALAGEQARRLLEPLAGEALEVASACRLLRMVGSVPCLTVLAGYPRGGPAPDWDILYPGESDVIQLVSHDSAKRRGPAATVLVVQARPAWSRRHLESPPEAWGAGLLSEAARLVGPWAADPVWSQAHRWRLARTDGDSQLSRPLLLSLPGGARLGIAGEMFAAGGGIEAAWSSGGRLAERLLEDAP